MRFHPLLVVLVCLPIITVAFNEDEFADDFRNTNDCSESRVGKGAVNEQSKTLVNLVRYDAVVSKERLRCVGIIVHPKYIMVKKSCKDRTDGDWNDFKLRFHGYCNCPEYYPHKVKEEHAIIDDDEFVLLELNTAVFITNKKQLARTAPLKYADNFTANLVYGSKQAQKGKPFFPEDKGPATVVEDEKCTNKYGDDYNPRKHICATLPTEYCGEEIGVPIWCEKTSFNYYPCAINTVELKYRTNKKKYACLQAGKPLMFRKLRQSFLDKIRHSMAMELLCTGELTTMWYLTFYGRSGDNWGTFGEDYVEDTYTTDDIRCDYPRSGASGDCQYSYRNRAMDFWTPQFNALVMKNARMFVETYNVIGEERFGYFEFNVTQRCSCTWFKGDNFLSTSFKGFDNKNWEFTRENGKLSYLVTGDGVDTCNTSSLFMSVVEGQDTDCAWSQTRISQIWPYLLTQRRVPNSVNPGKYTSTGAVAIRMQCDKSGFTFDYANDDYSREATTPANA